MKTETFLSSTGGIIVETYNDDGQRVGVVHKAGNKYSGKIAAIEFEQKVDNEVE
jgi:regulator of PEP synthase PpsR (kinase-PPPase family)